MIDMSGWKSIEACADLPTLDELLAAREEGRRSREHYQREIRRMRALTPEERSARARSGGAMATHRFTLGTDLCQTCGVNAHGPGASAPCPGYWASP